MKVESIEEVNKVDINLTFDPPWDRSMMSEEALFELGMM
ncbi:MAG: FeS assembly SUF system protein, partial [bacterium]|nr:FeS assembly SUF system protein [bacterium]